MFKSTATVGPKWYRQCMLRCGTATLATWQTSVAAANATGLVYSSNTPWSATLPNGTLPSGTIPQDTSVNQTVSAVCLLRWIGSSTINAGIPIL
ncbi:MAG: hypothetical protein IPL08_10460 [Saprospiraceae bacterium]|nr:hypothetical protein [Saprospiraceae bacterium]